MTVRAPQSGLQRMKVHNVTQFNWKLKVIQELVEGNDGVVGAANIRAKDGIALRPITKLYPLEVHTYTHKKHSLCMQHTTTATQQTSIQTFSF